MFLIILTKDHPELSSKQRDLALQLSRYDKKIKSAYLGAIFAIQQEKYHDRLVHFAQSLREVIDLLARSKQIDNEKSKPGKQERKRLLQFVIDPVGQQAYGFDMKYDTLADMYDKLSRIAHHGETISYDQACEKLSTIEDILFIFTMPQVTINEEIDKMFENPPSLKNAKKLTGFQSRNATQSKLIEKLSQEWLPFMIKVGFFNDPAPVTSPDNKSQFPNWIPSNYLVKCVKDFPEKMKMNCCHMLKRAGA